MSANFGMQRPDILGNRLTLGQYIAMWDALKETS